MTTATARHASRVDAIQHAAIQPWSAGPIFPFVIVRTDYYALPDEPSAHADTMWQAVNGPGGASTSEFFSREACEQAARDHLAVLALGRPQ